MVGYSPPLHFTAFRPLAYLDIRIGDEATVSKLKTRVDAFDVERGWKTHQSFAEYISEQDPETSTSSVSRYHNLFQGHPGAWQLNETVDKFLARLPPSSTPRTHQIDWIRISNPFLPAGDRQMLGVLKEGGSERLDIFSRFIAATNASGKPLLRIKKEIQREREDTVNDLRHLAAMSNVLSGKWMLFPEPLDADEVWKRVARATCNNELGFAAKIEPMTVTPDKQRLLCVYTKDFRDKDDVARVLDKLRSLELIRAGGKQMYYKSGKFCDPSVPNPCGSGLD